MSSSKPSSSSGKPKAKASPLSASMASLMRSEDAMASALKTAVTRRKEGPPTGAVEPLLMPSSFPSALPADSGGGGHPPPPLQLR